METREIVQTVGMRDFVDELQTRLGDLYDWVLYVDQGSLFPTNQNFVNYKINKLAQKIMTIQSQQTFEKSLVHESSTVAAIYPSWLQKRYAGRTIIDKIMRLRVGNQNMRTRKYAYKGRTVLS